MAWQEIVLALLPKITSLLSISGSVWIVGEVWFSHEKRFFVYHKLLLRMALYDILVSIWYFASTWPLPQEYDSYQALGTDTTCQVQGFFIQLHIANAIYFAMLGVYYMLVITYSYTEERLKTEHWETLFHWIPFLFSVGTSVAGVPLGLYHPDDLWCWIASSSSETDENESNIYQWAFSFGPMWTCFLIMLWALRKVFLGVKSQEQRMKKYATRPSISYTTTMTREEEEATTVGAREGAEDNSKTSRCCGCQGWIQSRILRIQNYWEHLPRTRQVMSQALSYAGAFWISNIFTLIFHLTRYHSSTNQSSFGLLLLQAIFQPLQGFLIFLSYRRPTYLRFRGKRNGCSRVQAAREALKWDLERKLNRGHTSQKPYRRASVGGGHYHNSSRPRLMQRMSDTILGGRGNSGGRRRFSDRGRFQCATPRRPPPIFFRVWCSRRNDGGRDGQDNDHSYTNSESSTRLQDYSTAQEHGNIQLSMSPDDSKENSVKLDSGLTSKPELQHADQDSSSTITTTRSSMELVVPNKRVTLTKETSLRFEDLVEDIEEVRNEEDDARNNRSTRGGEQREYRGLRRERSRRDFQMILETSRQFMNLVGMDIIPEADGNTEEKWRELFHRRQGSSKEFRENDGNRSMPTMHHDMLSPQARGAPLKAQETRLHPFVWTRQPLPFVFGARPERVETEALEETVTTAAFDRNIPGRSTSGGYFVRRVSLQTPDNRFWARLELAKKRKEIMKTITKNRFSHRNLDLNQTEPGQLDSSSPRTSLSQDASHNVVADSLRVVERSRPRDAPRAPKRSESKGDDNNEGGDGHFWAKLNFQKTRRDIMQSITKNRWSNRDIRGSQEEESQPNQPEETHSPSPADNNDQRPNEGSLRGILRSISKNHWSNRKLGDIPEASEHEDSHISVHRDDCDAIERGVNPTNRSSEFSSSNELSLVSHDSSLKTIQRSNRQGEQSETFSSGEWYGSNDIMGYASTDDISCDGISLVSEGPINISEELDANDDDDDDDDSDDDDEDDNGSDEDDADAGGSSDSSLSEDAVFENPVRLDQSRSGEESESSGIWERLEEARRQQDKLRDSLRSIQQASSSMCGNASVRSPPPSPRKAPEEKYNDDGPDSMV
jgi:hypothetical protein